MLIYLIRHAHARAGADDAARPLSARGRRQAAALARWLARRERFAATEIWHSPLVRARETARPLAGRSGPRRQLREIAGLAPDDAPPPVADKLRRVRRSVAIVGHEPHLSALATLLLTGHAGPAAVVLKKGAVLALERTGRHWQVRWLVSPALLGSSPLRGRRSEKM